MTKPFILLLLLLPIMGELSAFAEDSAARLAAMTPEEVRVFEDEGRTWKGDLMLDPGTGISHPDGFQAPDRMVYISYDRNRATAVKS